MIRLTDNKQINDAWDSLEEAVPPFEKALADYKQSAIALEAVLMQGWIAYCRATRGDGK